MGRPPPVAGEAWVADRPRPGWADRPPGWAEGVQLRAESPRFLHRRKDSWGWCRPFGLPVPPDRPTQGAEKWGRSADGVEARMHRRFPHAALPLPGSPPDPPPRQQSRHRRSRRSCSPHLRLRLCRSRHPAERAEHRHRALRHALPAQPAAGVVRPRPPPRPPPAHGRRAELRRRHGPRRVLQPRVPVRLDARAAHPSGHALPRRRPPLPDRREHRLGSGRSRQAARDRGRMDGQPRPPREHPPRQPSARSASASPPAPRWPAWPAIPQ